MEWLNFVEKIYQELQGGSAFNNFYYPIKSEQNLTQIMALRLRDIFAEQYRLPNNSDLLINHVTFREGPTERDKKAYRNAKTNRWVFFHDVFYAPDILIQDLNSNANILPIEVKLIKGKKQSPSQSIATAIGQALIYTAKYPHSIAFLGVLRSAQWGRYKFRAGRNESESKFYNKLSNLNMKVVVREVGLKPQGMAYNKICLPFRLLKTVVRQQLQSWKTALSNIAGVYLISDTMTGKQYVGSAYGDIGMWQRWYAYAATRHGGNKELRDLLKGKGDDYALNFLFTILEVVDLNATKEYITARECHWKDALLTRQYGYNSN